MVIKQRKNDVTIRYRTPDCLLGASSQRYFGSNFKKVNHLIEVTKEEEDSLYAICSIEWPKNWSRKKEIPLQPHIGTLDFFLISARLAEIFLKTVRKVDESQLSDMWISEFLCKAGNKCIDGHTHSCKCQLTSEISDSNNKTEFIFQVAIASSTVMLKIQVPDRDISNFSCMKSQIDRKGESYYSSYYKEASRGITNIRIDTQIRSITADYELIHDNSFSCKGLGSSYIPCITFCDMVLACGQLSQILLYQIDNTDREKASNLWLRNIHCIYRKPIEKHTNVSVKVKESKMVNLKGSYYNCSDLIFNFNNGDLIAECSSAYQPFGK